MISEPLIDKLIKQICKNLSSTDIKCRNKGYKRLKTTFSCSSPESCKLTYDHCILLWKGLHYWLWSQDKLVNQEALITNICDLLTKITDMEAKLQWIKAFFATQTREWKTLDKWRIDKFMMLVRRFFRQALADVAEDEWRKMDALIEILVLFPINEDRSDGAFGLRLHFADIYLEELSKFELSSDQWLKFLHPYFTLVPSLPRDHPLLKRIEDIFYLILPPTEEEEEEPLTIDMKDLANFCFHLAGRGGKNGKKIYEWAAICFSIVGEEPPDQPDTSLPSPPAPAVTPAAASAAAAERPMATVGKRKRKIAAPPAPVSPELRNGSSKSPPRKRRKMESPTKNGCGPEDSPSGCGSASAAPSPSASASSSASPVTSPRRRSGPAMRKTKERKRVSFGKIYRKPFKKKDAVKTPSPGTITSREAGKGILKKGLLRRGKKLNLNIR